MHKLNEVERDAIEKRHQKKGPHTSENATDTRNRLVHLQHMRKRVNKSERRKEHNSSQTF